MSDEGVEARHWNTPLLYRLPMARWRSSDNIVWLRVSARLNQGGGLSVLTIGPEHLLGPSHDWRQWIQIRLVSLLNVFVVSLGSLFLLVWWRYPAQRHYGYFGMAAVLMGLSNTNMVTTNIPLDEDWWELLVHLPLLWGPLLLALFPIGFAQLNHPRMERWALGFGAVTSAVILWRHDQSWLPIWGAAMVVVLAMDGMALVQLVRYVRREQPLRDNLLVCLAALGSLGLGTHDWMIRLGLLPFDEPYAMPYMTPLLMVALSWLIAGDYARSQQRLLGMNQELAERVRQREAELQTSFDQLAHVERERAAAAERSRILRDMHDGVGAHITTAMRQLQSGRAEPELVAQTLRDSLDQLKLSIDAMNLPPGDVNALLASLRYRLQRRIEAAGIALRWQVEALPVWAGGQQGDAMRHLQFIVFEALSNALQHSGATELLISASADADETIRITLQDNGCGLADAGSGSRTRLHTLHERAALLGARLDVEPAGPGCRVTVELMQAPHRLPLDQDLRPV